MSDLTYFTLQILRCNYRRKEIIKGKEKPTCETMEKEWKKSQTKKDNISMIITVEKIIQRPV